MGTARSIHVGIAMALTVTAAGFFSGIRGSANETPQGPQGDPPGGVATARSYADARAHRYGPNAGMYDGAFGKLSALPPPAPIVLTEEARLAALDKRAKRRAYDGAPPTVPHRVLQMGPLDCVSCHATGAKIGGVVAPKVSHPIYQSCTQCHVVMNDPREGAPKVAPPENTFEGIATWGKGSRAWKGAPPTIPHPTLMRPDCASCHGVFGADGIKTTHPWRQSCTQCHAANAEKDQHPPVLAP